jgi:hypothetical protein
MIDASSIIAMAGVVMLTLIRSANTRRKGRIREKAAFAQWFSYRTSSPRSIAHLPLTMAPVTAQVWP